MGLFKKYSGLATIVIGMGVAGIGGKEIYDYYSSRENIEISSKEEQKQRYNTFQLGLFMVGLGLFGMVLGYEDHSRYYLNGRDPLHLLREFNYTL